MSPILSIALFSILTLSSCASTPVSSATPKPEEGVAVPSPTAISIDETQRSMFPPSVDEKKKLLKEFKKALNEEEKALDHQERTVNRELSISQSARTKSWREQEKRARKAYFNQHTSGPDRRQYVQDYLKRKKDFEQSLKDELSSSKLSWKQKREFLKQTQKEKEIQFKSQLESGKRPDVTLWPVGH